MTNVMESTGVLVIGGGFYGLYLAEFLAKRGQRVTICERDEGLMRRASYVNQARVHNGYHYPRSILTAMRSRVNFPRFVEEFKPAIHSAFEKIYGVARRFSKVTADQFCQSMRRIGAPIREAPARLRKLFDATYIEAAFLTTEYAFDANKLREILADRVHRAGVNVRLRTEVRAVAAEDGQVRVNINGPDGETCVLADQVFCCGYSQLNAPGVAGGLEPVALKHELAELALVEVPESLQGLGVTIMDGPFFSLMPFPAEGTYTLSHVRYTPHSHWFEGNSSFRSAYDVFAETAKHTAFPHMVRDAARYLPSARKCRYRGSLWEVKTVMPRSEVDDSRPILFRPNFGLANYHLVMGGKIDNVYDVLEVMSRAL